MPPKIAGYEPFLELFVQQRPTHDGKGRHKTNRKIARFSGAPHGPANSSKTG